MEDALASPAPEKCTRTRLLRFGGGVIRVLAPPAVRLAGAGVQFLSTVLIARQLGDEGSALFFFWSAVLTSFAPVATYGLEHIALRNTPRLNQPGRHEELQRYLAGLRMVSLALAFLIGAALLVYAIVRPDSHGLHSWQFVLPFVLPAMSLAVINGEALKGLSRPVAGVFFGHFLPVTLFCILIAVSHDKIDSAFLVVLYAIAWVVGFTILRFGPLADFRTTQFALPKGKEFRAILTEGFPVFCTNSLGALSYIIPLVILDFLRPPEEVSYVTTAFRISILLAILAAAIHGVYAPKLSLAAEGSGRRTASVYLKITGTTLFALGLPYAVGILFPEWVMSIFGDNFRTGASTLRLLLAAGLLALCLGPVLQLLLMLGKTRWMARLGVGKLTLVTILSAILIPRYGGIGMVIAMSVAFALEELVGLALAFLHLRGRSRQRRAP